MHAILLKDLGQVFDLSSCRCSQSPNRDWADGCRRFDGSVTRHAGAKSGAMAKGRTSSVFYRFSERSTQPGATQVAVDLGDLKVPVVCSCPERKRGLST